jgi:glycosyltransferase involved in cell wall biosynthesis/2-polyprenyl-3-methyl-5-hydroxy-6-metoxy-1,4-benzoquinol methylase
MRIVFLNPSGHLGGAEACLLDMIAVLRTARPQWKISVVLGEGGPLEERVRLLGADVAVVPFSAEIASLGDSGATGKISLLLRMLMSAPAALSYRNQLRRSLDELKPDILHSNGFKMHVLGALTKPARSKLIWHVHDYVSSRSIMAAILKRFSDKADTIVTNSRSVADDVRKIIGNKKIVPVLNVVDLEEFSPIGPTLDLPVKSTDAVRVGLVATMAWWKGHRLFLDAIAKLDRQFPVHAYIVGGSLYQTDSRQESIQALQKYAAELGIQHRVTFTGFVAEPASAIRALDVVVHASTEPEPFGRVIVEAMACGRPVITNGLGGAAEILATGAFGLTFKTGDSSSLAEAISKLAGDRDLRSRLGQNGLAAARLHFGRERLLSELPPIYETLLGVSGPNLSVEQSRIRASEASGGTSGEAIYRAVLGVIEDLDLKGSVLDFGAGTGSFARRLQQSGRFGCVAAADLMARPENADGIHWMQADLNESLPASPNSFDSIVAAEVIEHLENPRSMARELYRVLKPDGVAIISTPNNESWRSLLSLLLRGHYVEFCNGSYPAHITALLRTDLDRIFREAGFRGIEFRFTNHGALPGRPTTSWQRASAGGLKGLRFSDNVLAICHKAKAAR